VVDDDDDDDDDDDEALLLLTDAAARPVNEMDDLFLGEEVTRSDMVQDLCVVASRKKSGIQKVLKVLDVHNYLPMLCPCYFSQMLGYILLSSYSTIVIN
jgi:hypothetical protein